ncbi:hypothetical protein [Pseudomonas sp. KNUC1026]|uniref:hypothetical protein n=1 Tax=Pseudomonas sp. KNUC1026 TaxID=2893890 RepID=UPI001F29BFFA|nr:hypothetical protein [Pseudomonas sp. KNUC1026]UFH48484.1 hypothetical protein LN139_15410 [Pseudomonas sp. KNUC1026]
MLSEKLKNHLKARGWWFDDESQEYELELLKLGIPKHTDFGEFYLHAEDGPSFLSGGKEIHHICWFSRNTNFSLALQHAEALLGTTDEYIPLDSFEAESGYFYNKRTEEVFEITLGANLADFHNGNLKARWESFNSFLEDYFGIK